MTKHIIFSLKAYQSPKNFTWPLVAMVVTFCQSETTSLGQIHPFKMQPLYILATLEPMMGLQITGCAKNQVSILKHLGWSAFQNLLKMIITYSVNWWINHDNIGRAATGFSRFCWISAKSFVRVCRFIGHTYGRFLFCLLPNSVFLSDSNFVLGNAKVPTAFPIVYCR